MSVFKGYARIFTAQPRGVGAELVTVEADLSRGLHTFSIVGLADKAVAESRERISSAIKHVGFTAPKSLNRRIVLSLSPASLRKDGSRYDLPLALAYLHAVGAVREQGSRYLVCGELGLEGSVKPASDVVSFAMCARAHGIPAVYVPRANVREALLVPGITVYGVEHLAELIAHLNKESALPAAVGAPHPPHARMNDSFDTIHGQEGAKRALLIAAAGKHAVLLYGPPGTGKTMLARALPSILPPLDEASMLEATAVHAAAGYLAAGSIIAHPPFRAPHHTLSVAAMIGGGSPLRPGEISLSHKGVLFMDEFTEFDTRTFESLRQPLEDKRVTIARASGALEFPADVMLVAALNPADTLSGDDSVMRQKSLRQAQKLSRPIIDRIDLWVEVPRQALSSASASHYSSERMAAEVAEARARGSADRTVSPICSAEARNALDMARERLGLSARGQTRTLQIARTIAMLEGKARIEMPHLMEALQYRPKAPFV